jgi:hypothetical protein
VALVEGEAAAGAVAVVAVAAAEREIEGRAEAVGARAMGRALVSIEDWARKGVARVEDEHRCVVLVRAW